MHVLLCTCSVHQRLPEAALAAARAVLGATAVEVTEVDDLCGVAARRESWLAESVGNGPLAVLACHERSVRWLLRRAGAATETVRSINLHTFDPGDLSTVLTLPEGAPRWTTGSRPDDWRPWFPVIDQDRCESCQQCASFCLFGVFEVRSKSVEVRNPAGCKDGCPACARICPHGAIIFPKLDESPYNGAPVTDEQELRERVQASVDRILGDDVYAALARRRSKARLLREEAHQLAEAERQRHMAPEVSR